MPRANAGGTTQAQFDAVLARLNAVEQVNQSVVMRLNAAEQVNHEMVARLNVSEQTNHNLIGQLKSGRKHSRTMAYTSMLNTFLNIIKFAGKQEPKVVRRSFKYFQNTFGEALMQQFYHVVYPGRKTDQRTINAYFSRVDSLHNSRNRRTHPRSIIELSAEAHDFAAMLGEHRTYGDVLNPNESLFLDVFSRIDELHDAAIGNL